jgi:hypothetical protein
MYSKESAIFLQELEILTIVRQKTQVITWPVCFSADRNWGRVVDVGEGEGRGIFI